ncbi:MAG: PKD domain-containing protein [Bacteroidales bacterium]
MTKRIYHITILLSIAFAGIFAQENIVADTNLGCDTLEVFFSLDGASAPEDYSSVIWNFGDGTSASNVLEVSHTYTRPGIFTVRCVLNGARVIERLDFISVGQTPYADFIYRDTSATETEFNYYFEPAYFEPNAGVTLDYTWRFPDGSEVYEREAEYAFEAENMYEIFLHIEDNLGCADSITKMIPVAKQLLIPNVFSPNGDQVNDYFEVTTPGDYTYSFRIFTRSGMQVYYSDSPVIRWDGRTTGGREVPEGVYFYIIESNDTPVETSLSGFMHLFR